MKKIGLMVLLFLLFCGCTSKQAGDLPNVTPNSEKHNEELSTADKPAEKPSTVDKPAIKSEYIVKTLNAFHTETVDDMLDFMANPRENNLYPCLPDIFRFVEQEGRLVLKNMAHGDNPTFYDIDGANVFAEPFNSGKYCSRAVAFLCDENAIKQRFHDHGINGIRDIVIIDFADDKVGYIIAAVTEKEAYYMAVPLAAEVYGDYIFQKVYTSDEFKKVYGPRPAKVFINEKEVKFSSKTLLGENYLEMDILDFLNAFGIKCKYNEKSKEITAGDYKIRFEYDSEEIYDIFVTEPSTAERQCGWAEYRNGRYLGSGRIITALCYIVGYQYEFHYDDYSVHVYKDKGQKDG